MALNPVVDGPSLFYRSCEKKLAKKNSYQSYTLSIYPIDHLPQSEGTLEPNAENPSSFCCVCKTRYKNRGGYRDHLKSSQMLLQHLMA